METFCSDFKIICVDKPSEFIKELTDILVLNKQMGRKEPDYELHYLIDGKEVHYDERLEGLINFADTAAENKIKELKEEAERVRKVKEAADRLAKEAAKEHRDKTEFERLKKKFNT